MDDRIETAGQTPEMLINGVDEIADSLAGTDSESQIHEQSAGTQHSAGTQAESTDRDGTDDERKPEPVSRAAECRSEAPEPPNAAGEGNATEENSSADSSRSSEDTPPESEPAPDATKKSSGFGPRWSYVLTRGPVVALVWAFFAFAFDPLIRFGAITAGEQAVQARVDIADLETSFFPPKIKLTDVAVANRNQAGQNLFEFSSLDGNVDGLALMHGSYVIDRAVVTGLTWDTPREDDGLLPEAPSAEESGEQGEGFGGQLEKAGKEWAEDLFERAKLEYDPRQLESVRLAQHLEVEWSSDFENMEGRVQQVDAEARELRKLIEKAKEENPIDRVKVYRQVATDGTRLLRKVNVIREDLKRLPGKAEGDLDDLDQARQRDQAKIKRKVEDLVLDGENLSEFLLGPTLHHRIRNVLAWLDWGRKRVDEFSSRPKPERHRGEKITLPAENPLPGYLARLIEVTGSGDIGGERMNVEGSILDVSSDPQLYGKPTVMRMKGQGNAKVTMKAELARTTETPANTLDLVYRLDNPVTKTLGDEDSLKVELQAGSTKWNAHISIVDDQLLGTVMLVQKPVVLTPEVKTGDEALRRVIAASMQNVDRIDATVHLSGTVQKPELRLDTRLGETISDGIREGIGNEVSSQKDALIARLNEDLNKRQSELIGLFRNRYGDMLKELQARETGLQELVPKVAGRRFDPSKIFR